MLLFFDTATYLLIVFLYCTDVHECDLQSDDCHQNAQCINTNGSFVCNCNDGYSGNGVVCESRSTRNFQFITFMYNYHAHYVFFTVRNHIFKSSNIFSY